MSGRIDLIYEDPVTKEVVVVDYKTDDLPDHAACEARAAAYRGQAEIYARALGEGWGLPARPRVELWFLGPGIVVTL